MGVFAFFDVTLYIVNLRILLILWGVSVFAGWLVGAYDRDTSFVSLRYAAEAIIAGIAAMVVGPGLVALFGNYGGTYQPSRTLMVMVPALFTAGSLAARRWMEHFSGGYKHSHRIIVLGNEDEGAALDSAIKLTDRLAQVNCLTAEDACNGALEASLSGSTDEESVGGRLNYAVVIAPSVSPSAVAALRPFLVSLHTSTVPVYSWSAFWSLRVRMHDCSGDSAAWLFEKDYQFSRSSAYGHIKRVLDVVASFVGLILAAPLLLLAAVAIKLDSPGQVFFRQKRIGARGQSFDILKLRTMASGSELQGATTVKNDSRQTRVGRFLRRTRIDELPQLWNVLKGDMSLVGPRPEWTVCVERYETVLPCYHLRHLVKPGITGWAQVNYPYGEGTEDARKKLAFDLFYVSNGSLTLDFCIILKTVYVLIGRIGGR
jgi:exopolysaccharide biosynthesis polyprenyl glycosylphosphotransferase